MRQVQKRGGKGKKSKKGKIEREKLKGKGAVLFLSLPNSLFLFPSLPSPFEASYTDIRTACSFTFALQS